MDRYIGLDAHASSCTLAVVSPRGKRLGSQVVETNARCVKKTMLAEAKRHPEYRVVRSCPGLGPVRTAELLPIVVTPFRFQSKRGFWS